MAKNVDELRINKLSPRSEVLAWKVESDMISTFIENVGKISDKMQKEGKTKLEFSVTLEDNSKIYCVISKIENAGFTLNIYDIERNNLYYIGLLGERGFEVKAANMLEREHSLFYKNVISWIKYYVSPPAVQKEYNLDYESIVNGILVQDFDRITEVIVRDGSGVLNFEQGRGDNRLVGFLSADGNMIQLRVDYPESGDVYQISVSKSGKVYIPGLQPLGKYNSRLRGVFEYLRYLGLD